MRQSSHATSRPNSIDDHTILRPQSCVQKPEWHTATECWSEANVLQFHERIP
jgi:hypothetical protein